jgi:hypothetical protein
MAACSLFFAFDQRVFCFLGCSLTERSSIWFAIVSDCIVAALVDWWYLDLWLGKESNDDKGAWRGARAQREECRKNEATVCLVPVE